MKKAKSKWILLWITIFFFLPGSHSEGFVEEVLCSSESLTVVINSSDPDVARWIANPKSQPVVYVYGHKTRHPCGTSMKNEKGQTNFNLTIPYGKECDVSLIDLQPNHQSAETAIALEDNADLSYAKNFRVNHVFCLYASSVQTIRFNDVSNGHEVIASTGGKPKPKVEMLFRSVDGKSLRAAKIGDTVEFFVALSPDMAYHGITPKECVFSDREDINSPDAKRMTFVQNGCPVDTISEIIDPLANVNDQVYFSKFKTFRFGNQSTVFAHCVVQVCLRKEECSQSCYKKVTNSNLTAERLRFRHRRSVKNGTTAVDAKSEIELSNTLTILTDNESQQLTTSSFASKEVVTTTNAGVSAAALGVIAVLFLLLIVSISMSVYLANKLRHKAKDSFDMMSAYSGSTATMSLPLSYAVPRNPHGVYSFDQYR